MDGPSALKTAQDLSAKSFSSSDRRRYFEHLLTLPSYKVQSINAYYAKSIARNFNEFEDLQNQAVDAVLDLCEDEDEQTRICGIQALAEIGKVEPRWVRGNTGVLLQLLECPPSELRHVKQALFDLLEVSPSEVFSIMAEDCKGSEADTGASRRNILEFLNTDAKSQRKELLESGKFIEAENTFSSGFYDVLSTTAIAESRLILSLLLPLSTISGRNNTRATSGKFAKTLIKCLHSKSSIGLTMPLMKLWDEFVANADGLDPRWTICFLSDHGDAVFQAALEKGDKEAKSILEYPNTNTSKRLGRYFDRDSDRSEPELEARKLIPAFAQTMLDPVLRYSTKSKIEPKDIYILELVVYGVYTILTLDRHMRDHMPKPLSRQLVEFGKLANKNKRNAKDDTTEEAWRNLRDMAEIMSDRNERAITIQSSWTIKTKVKAKSKSRSPVKSARRVSPGPSTISSSSALKVITPNAPAGIRSQVAEPLSKVAAATDSLAIPPPSVRVQETVPPTRPAAPVPSARAAVPVIAPTIPLSAPTSVPVALTPGPSGLNIRSRANHQPTPIASTPMEATELPAAVTTKVLPASLNILARARQAPIDTLASAPAATQGLSIRATSKPAETSVPASQGMSIRASSEIADRPRPTPTAPPSLLSRMSQSITNIKRPHDDLTTQKHLQNDTQTQIGVQWMMQKPPVPSQPPMEKCLNNAPAPTSSLLSRMTPRGVSASAPSAGQVTTLPTAVFSIKRSGSNLPPKPASGTAPSPTSSGFSIKNRSISSSSLNTSTASSTGTTSTGSGLSIKRKVVDEPLHPTPAKVVDDDAPIIRKGRGFAPGAGAGYTQEVLITPPPIVHRPTSNSFNLADRLGIKKSRFA